MSIVALAEISVPPMKIIWNHFVSSTQVSVSLKIPFLFNELAMFQMQVVHIMALVAIAWRSKSLSSKAEARRAS